MLAETPVGVSTFAVDMDTPGVSTRQTREAQTFGLRIATIELTNPEKRNAMDVEMAAQFVDVCDAVDADPSVGGALLHGGRSLCSGGDRADLDAATKAPLDDANFERISAIYNAFVRFGHLRVPTVAAIRGAAVGGRAQRGAGGGGVFHIGFVVDDVDEATEQVHARGLTTWMSGRRGDRTGFTYFRTPEIAGVTLEVRQCPKS